MKLNKKLTCSLASLATALGIVTGSPAPAQAAIGDSCGPGKRWVSTDLRGGHVECLIYIGCDDGGKPVGINALNTGWEGSTQSQGNRDSDWTHHFVARNRNIAASNPVQPSSSDIQGWQWLSHKVYNGGPRNPGMTSPYAPNFVDRYPRWVNLKRGEIRAVNNTNTGPGALLSTFPKQTAAPDVWQAFTVQTLSWSGNAKWIRNDDYDWRSFNAAGVTPNTQWASAKAAEQGMSLSQFLAKTGGNEDADTHFNGMPTGDDYKKIDFFIDPFVDVSKLKFSTHIGSKSSTLAVFLVDYYNADGTLKSPTISASWRPPYMPRGPYNEVPLPEHLSGDRYFSIGGPGSDLAGLKSGKNSLIFDVSIHTDGAEGSPYGSGVSQRNDAGGISTYQWAGFPYAALLVDVDLGNMVCGFNPQVTKEAFSKADYDDGTLNNPLGVGGTYRIPSNDLVFRYTLKNTANVPLNFTASDAWNSAHGRTVRSCNVNCRSCGNVPATISANQTLYLCSVP